MNKKPEYTLVKSDSANNALTWVIQVGGKVVGNIDIDLENTAHVESPSVKMRLDETNRGIDTAVMKEIIKYAYCNLPSEVLYSRQQLNDATTDTLNKSLGFEKDGDAYADDDGLTWQNVKLVL